MEVLEVTILCIILGMIAVITLTSLFLLLNDITKITKQMSYKNRTKSHFDISIQSNHRSIKRLQYQINELYAKVNDVEELAFQKEKEMQTLMSGISHDIRTPLTSIKGYLKLIQETTDEKEKQKYYSIVEYRLDTLESMLEDFFVHSKITDSEYKLKKEEIEIFPIICKVMASYYYDFERKGIEPQIHFSNEHIKVLANQDTLVRMVHNLVQNVLKHGCDYFEIKECNRQIYFINKVIHSENIEVNRLFDRFYQADLSRHQNSTGLGLSIVKQIVEIHGWNISASIEGNQLSVIIDV